MKQYIGCDAHARYSVFVSVDEAGKIGPPIRVDHFSRELRDYLGSLEPETPVAVEASGGWYWFMDELEAAGLDARLVNPLEARRRIGGVIRRTRSMRGAWPSCCAPELCLKSGYRRLNCGTCAV